MSTPSVETRIYQAIKARVSTLPVASTYPIKWSDGPAYEPQATERYLRATWIPNQTQRMFIGSSDPHRRPGILQIDVFATVAQGSGVAREVAGQVAAHFATDLTMTFMGVKARVLKAPSVGPVFVDTHIQVPVTIEVETNG